MSNTNMSVPELNNNIDKKDDNDKKQPSDTIEQLFILISELKIQADNNQKQLDNNQKQLSDIQQHLDDKIEQLSDNQQHLDDKIEQSKIQTNNKIEQLSYNLILEMRKQGDIVNNQLIFHENRLKDIEKEQETQKNGFSCDINDIKRELSLGKKNLSNIIITYSTAFLMPVISIYNIIYPPHNKND